MLQLNWIHFKPEIAGRQDEDADAHLLRTNDWMDTHAFQEDFKVQRFCLRSVGEATFWHESFRPIAIDLNGVQGQFRQQYSRIGNTREQLFHVWRSFHFDKNSETIDSYITYKRQVAGCLGYGEPLILEDQDFIGFSFI